METIFDLKKVQKRGFGDNKVISYLIGGLIAIVLIAALAPTMFNFLGTGTGGLGNTSENPSVPTWLSPVAIILLAVGLLYMLYRAIGAGAKK